jgi:2-polyprenyl-6-methoxyphenol hydroxylase-like FAD-dependent oxidoreductase
MKQPNRHAIVVGSSIGGLLAARVLADVFDEVTLFERDTLPPLGEQRKGVPHGRHAHGLLGGGLEVLESLFPGLTRDLEAHGANVGDTQEAVRWYFGGASVKAARSGVTSIGVSRPLLEGYVRQRLSKHPRLRFLERHEVRGVVASADRSAILGVRFAPVGRDKETMLASDLVVDCSGRGSQSLAWLEALGYPRPKEERFQIDLSYASAVFERHESDLNGLNAIVSGRSRNVQRGAALIAQEGNRWLLTLGGYGDDVPPTDFQGFRSFCHGLAALEVLEIVREERLIGEIVPFKFPASVRRYFERLERHPRGFLAFGDAICSFNPVYGQGMTTAAKEAMNLQRVLEENRRDFAARFYALCAETLETPWNTAVTNDLTIPSVKGIRTPKRRFVMWYMERLYRAAWRDTNVARALLRVVSLLDSPDNLLRPNIASSVLRHNLFVFRARQSAPSQTRERASSPASAQAGMAKTTK